jgi:hypothetical protein
VSARAPFAVIPCAREKAWDDGTTRGPVAARDAYRGPLFAAALAWAEARADQVLILSALHGLLPAEAPVPGPYDVTFSRAGDPCVSEATLAAQARALGLAGCQRPLPCALPDDYAARLASALGPAAPPLDNLLAGLALDDLEAMRRRVGAARAGARGAAAGAR